MTVPRFRAAKAKGHKLSVLTAYDFLWAGILDAAGVDAILVGDTLGMVVQGHATTLPVTLDEIIYHAEMVVRATRRALVIVDMPFLSFQVSPSQAIANAGRILKETGAAAVKLEGGVSQAETIRALSVADIPVVAHVGMKPQSVHSLGGLGKMQRDEESLLQDAQAV
jgi:3-methyl-2-oxobutanoate hydroxymethyltransferase